MLSFVFGLGAVQPANALDIVYTNTGLDAGTMSSLEQAASILESLLTDNVTVRVNVGTGSLGSGVIANTSTARVSYTYSTVRAALGTQSTSAADASSVAQLQSGSSVAMMTTNGAGARIYDNNNSANNQNVLMTTANAKALGLYADGGAADASISFSGAYLASFDNNRADGLTGYDGVGIALHELVTALGFMSGVDMVDTWAHYGMSTDGTAVVSTLDLFRFSSDSLSHGAGVIEEAAGAAAYFSVDGGATSEGNFGTGVYSGGGSQASRWAPGTGGIMNPSASQGQLLEIQQNEKDALDVMGWEITPAQYTGDPNPGGGTPGGSGTAGIVVTPEPASMALFGLGLGALGLIRRRRRRT